MSNCRSVFSSSRSASLSGSLRSPTVANSILNLPDAAGSVSGVTVTLVPANSASIAPSMAFANLALSASNRILAVVWLPNCSFSGPAVAPVSSKLRWPFSVVWTISVSPRASKVPLARPLPLKKSLAFSQLTPLKNPPGL